jgi:3-hydroxyacyl-CoA dehydrogenase/3-hydroxy-2-methylbutyryl-CoA dehydrogenase
MESKLKGAVALITGAGSGLGKATAERLARNGVHVFALDLPHVVEKIGKNNEVDSGNINFRAADVTSELDITTVLKEIEAKHHRLDYVVNCAGILVLKPVYDFTLKEPHSMEALLRVFQVNVFGTFNVIRLSVELMSKNHPSNADGERGVIINVSSVSGDEGVPGSCAYSASKGAIQGMTVPLARELGPSGIRVVCIAPGTLDTPMIHAFYASSENSTAAGGCTQCIFPKRDGHPEEFAQLAQSIIENSLINATTIRLDAGYRSKNN